MEWHRHQMRQGNLEIAFKWRGAGPGLLICLHGYGQDRNAFDAVLGKIPSGWRVICVDLPGFGESAFVQDAHLRPEDLFALASWAEAAQPVERLMLAGYSLGGKTALGMLMHGSRRVQGVMLLAPDGLKIHPVYKFCVYHPLGRVMFRLTLRYPWGLLLCLRMLIFLKLGDTFKYRLAAKQLGDRHSRRRLRQVWEGYSGFGPDRALVERADQLWQPVWRILWGNRDEVVPPHLGAEFATWIPRAEFHSLEGGHLLLRDCAGEVEDFIHEMLNDL